MDCGCHAGQYTMFFALIAGSKGAVYAFDPFPQNNIQVETNAILNGLKNVHVENAGVGAQKAKFKVSNKQQNLLDAEASDAIDVKSVPLDDYAKFGPTFLKLDVEGFEVEAMKGAQKLLRKCAPRAYIEVHPQFLPRFGADSRDLFRLIPLDVYDAYLLSPEMKTRTKTKLDVDFIMRQPGVLMLEPKAQASGAAAAK